MTQEIDIAALRKAAQEVGGGDWAVIGESIEGTVWSVAGGPVCECYDLNGDRQDRTVAEKEVADYIAAASPSVILALLDRLEQAEKDAARYRLLRNGGAAADRIVEDMYEGTLMHEEIDHACDAAMQGEGA